MSLRGAQLEPRHLRLGEEGDEVAVDVGGGVELFGLTRRRGVVGETQDAHRLRVEEGRVEEILRETQGGGVHRQEPETQALDGVVVLEGRLAKARERIGPLVAALVERIRPAVAAPLAPEEEGFAEVGFAVGLVIAVLRLLEPAGHVADAPIVHQQRPFARLGQRVEPRGLGKDAVDECLRYAVVGDKEEADLLEGALHLCGQGCQGVGLPGQEGLQVEDRDHVAGVALLGVAKDRRDGFGAAGLGGELAGHERGHAADLADAARVGPGGAGGEDQAQLADQHRQGLVGLADLAGGGLGEQMRQDLEGALAVAHPDGVGEIEDDGLPGERADGPDVVGGDGLARAGVEGGAIEGGEQLGLAGAHELHEERRGVARELDLDLVGGLSHEVDRVPVALDLLELEDDAGLLGGADELGATVDAGADEDEHRGRIGGRDVLEELGLVLLGGVRGSAALAHGFGVVELDEPALGHDGELAARVEDGADGVDLAPGEPLVVEGLHAGLEYCGAQLFDGAAHRAGLVAVQQIDGGRALLAHELAHGRPLATRVATTSTCGVIGTRSNTETSTMSNRSPIAVRSRARVAGSQDT